MADCSANMAASTPKMADRSANMVASTPKMAACFPNMVASTPKMADRSANMAASTPKMAASLLYNGCCHSQYGDAPPPKDGGSHQKRELPTPKMAPPTGLTGAAILPEVTHRAQVGSGRGQAGGGRWGGSAPRGAALPIGQRGRGVAAALGKGGRGFRRPRPPITF